MITRRRIKKIIKRKGRKALSHINAHTYAHPAWLWWCHWVYYPIKFKLLPGHIDQAMLDCPLCEIDELEGDGMSTCDHYGCTCAFDDELFGPYDYEDEEEED